MGLNGGILHSPQACKVILLYRVHVNLIITVDIHLSVNVLQLLYYGNCSFRNGKSEGGAGSIFHWYCIRHTSTDKK